MTASRTTSGLRTRGIRRLVSAGLALCAAAAPGAANTPHDGPDAALHALERRLALSPDDPGLLLERADLLRRRGDLEDALLDVERAAGSARPPVGLPLVRARVLDDAGRPAEALDDLRRLLARAPRDPEGLVLSARLLGRLERLPEAEAAWNAALASLPRPEPDHYLARARIAASLDVGRALAGLREGLSRLGPSAPLLRAAADLELGRGRPQAARELLAALTTGGVAPARAPTGGSGHAEPAQGPPPPAPLTTLVPVGATWRYLDDGSDQGTAWQAPGFDDSGWAQGPAQLGYGDGDEATVVSFGPFPGAKHVTTYFRHAFEVVDPSAYAALHLQLLRDDGAVVHLNGAELYRSNLLNGPILAGQLAGQAIAGVDEDAFHAVALPPGGLVAGENVLAVEIHQTSVMSSDISFDLVLEAGPSIAVSRGPYLQRATPDSVVVRWSTTLATDARVAYGPAPGQLVEQAVDASVGTTHEVLLAGLTPGATYHYAVGSSTGLLAGDDGTHRFTTPPPAGTAVPTRVWAIGDSGTAGAGAQAVRDAYLASTGGQAPDVWLMLGDNAYYHGTGSDYQEGLFNTYAELLRQTAPWPARGNHDLYAGVWADVFTLPAAAEAGGVPSGIESYYSFDHGDVHFVCLDSFGSDRAVGGAMWTWLQCDLAASTSEWLIAYWHHPPYSKGSHDSDAEIELVEMRGNFLPLLEAAGVDLVLCGHSHSYERSVLLDGHHGVSTTLVPEHVLDGGDGDELGDGAYAKPAGPHEGAVYCVAGCSAKLTAAPLDHPAMLVSLLTLGSLVLDIDGNRLDASFLDATGATLDTFTILHEAPVAWDDLGDGLPGTHGAPVLGAEGTLQPGSALDLLLCSARENAATTLFVGLSVLAAPFKGGVLVPHPDLVVPGLSTDADGTVSLGATWPAGVPSGSTLVVQAWLVDPAGPAGLAASNAVVGTSP